MNHALLVHLAQLIGFFAITFGGWSGLVAVAFKVDGLVADVQRPDTKHSCHPYKNDRK